jgi:hypothetical protein
MSLYVDRDNNRFGAVRVMISPQDEINKRRSKALHLITMRQFRMGRGAVEDKETIRKELAKPDGGIMADDGDFQILETADMARGNFEMLIDAKQEIDLLGANAALSGKNENDMSGRAILAQQQGGMVEVARMFDRLRTLSIEVYRAIWNRIRQFWTEEKWVRVTDDERNLRFVGLNQKITVKMLAQEVAEGDEKAIQKASQIVGPQLLQAAMQGDQQAATALGLFVQQYGDQVVEVRNAVNELDVDIVIDEGMDTPSVQAEQFEMLAKVLPTAVNLPPPYLKALILASSLRGKDQLIEEVEKASQGPQIPPEVQQQMQEAMQRLQELEAENQALKLDAQGKQVDAAIKQEEIGVKRVDQALKGKEIEQKSAELEIDVYRAQTERMEKMAPIEEARERNDKADAMSGQMADHVKALTELVAHMSKPKRRVPVRDDNGFIVEIREEAA